MVKQQTSSDLKSYSPAAREEHGESSAVLQLECFPEKSSLENSTPSSAATIQRQCENCEEEEELQMKSSDLFGSSISVVDPWIQTQIDGSLGQGQSLDTNTQSFMESRMDHDFSEVNIHTGGDAAQLNRKLGARAFTVGSDIYFNSGEYQPSSTAGKKLLAHELTHTIQQGSTTKAVQQKTLIQRKSIPYKQLSWDDFKGKASSSKYEAYTSSELTDPKTEMIKPEAPVITNAGKCEDTEQTRYKARLEYKLEDFVVEARFNPKSSWKQAWTTSTKAQKKRCDVEGVKSCKTNIKSDAARYTKEDIKACKEGLKDNDSLLFDCQGTEKKVAKAADCDDLKSCFKKNNLATSTWSKTFNEKFTISATGIDDCDTKVKNECENTLMPNLSADLLKHEQGHLDITQRFAEKIQADLRAKAAELTTEADGCSKEEAEANARKALEAKKPGLEFSKIWTEGKAELKAVQGQYDDETDHSTKAEQQGDWDVKITTGEFESDE